MFFSNSLAFSRIQQMLAIWSLVPLPFLNPEFWLWTSGCSWFTYCWSLVWRILSITLLACTATAAAKLLQLCPTLCDPMWDEYNCVVVWAFFGIAFLWDWNENWTFSVLWPLLSFPNLLAYWVQHFHSIIFLDLK